MTTFTIPGNPIPQKQTRFANGHAYDPSKKDKERIQNIAKQFFEKPTQEAIILQMTFCLPIPKSTSKKRMLEMIGTAHIKKPDIDNLAYLVTNALKAIAYKDDSQVFAIKIFKSYSLNPQTEVMVTTITQARKHTDATD